MARIPFLTVSTRRPPARLLPTRLLLVLVGLLAFQAQAFAGLTLPCQHELPEQASGCLAHGPVAPTGDPVPLDPPRLDCVKCTLALALGALAAPPEPWRLAATTTTPSPRAPEHFYRFFPDRPLRPPQPPLSLRRT
jgi:hypothetical protein